MKLIVGLGNPDDKYKNSRHNSGFMALDYFTDQNNWPEFVNQTKWRAHTSEQDQNEQKVILAKPQTYMNGSGLAVQNLVNFYKVSPSDLLVVYDELALPFGKVRLREGGSSAGHNGVKSVIENVGDSFVRLRIGIDRPHPAKQTQEDFVLASFSREEEQNLPYLFDYTNHVIHQFINGDKLEPHTEDCLPNLIE